MINKGNYFAKLLETRWKQQMVLIIKLGLFASKNQKRKEKKYWEEYLNYLINKEMTEIRIANIKEKRKHILSNQYYLLNVKKSKD